MRMFFLFVLCVSLALHVPVFAIRKDACETERQSGTTIPTNYSDLFQLFCMGSATGMASALQSGFTYGSAGLVLGFFLGNAGRGAQVAGSIGIFKGLANCFNKFKEMKCSPNRLEKISHQLGLGFASSFFAVSFLGLYFASSK